MDPGPISFILLSPVYFTRIVYFLVYYYCFPLDTLIPLFTANRWDWQPHRKLGAKYLVALCAGSTLLLAKQSLHEAPYKLSGAVAKLAGITFWSLAFSWTDKPWFLTKGKTCSCAHHTFLLGFPTGRWLTSSTPCCIKDFFWHCCRGKRRLLQGEFRTHILYFVLSFAFTLFIFACIVLSKIQKN
jgi:hypothetical protein